MTDQMIPADKVRKIAARFRQQMEPHVSFAEFLVWERAAEAVEALLPAPSRPTLADMTEEERRACQWMQADVKGYEFTAGIIAKINQADAHLIASDGETWFLAFDTVTPRPDLPRLEWPSDTPVGPDHLAVGTVIESADDPRLSALPVGSVLLDRVEETVTKRSLAWMGRGYAPEEDGGAEFGPWTVLHIPKEEA